MLLNNRVLPNNRIYPQTLHTIIDIKYSIYKTMVGRGGGGLGRPEKIIQFHNKCNEDFKLGILAAGRDAKNIVSKIPNWAIWAGSRYYAIYEAPC